MERNVSVFWVFSESSMKFLKGGSLCCLEGPTGQHELVDRLGAALRLVQTVVLILNHLQDLGGEGGREGGNGSSRGKEGGGRGMEAAGERRGEGGDGSSRGKEGGGRGWK